MAKSSGKRGTFTFRVTAGLRAKLEAAARADERPVSEIIEAALEAHFTGQDQRAMLREVVVEALDEREAAARERMGGFLPVEGIKLFDPRSGLLGKAGSRPSTQTYDRSALNKPQRVA